MDNKTKSDRIHELLPRLLASRQDPNWSALVEAIGEEDDRLARLIAEVRDQFFVKTASRPYLDRLAANSEITRPRFIGMSDTDFRKYIPVLSYQPKQVRQIIDTLLDLFFLKEATTAFLSSSLHEPFALKNHWQLAIDVDGFNTECVTFTTADFSDIAQASAEEVAAAYNRQAKYSFATVFFDSVLQNNYIRIFTNTIGTQGSLQITSGLANIGLQLNGFLSTVGTGVNTQWSITKVGETTTFTHTGGADPGLNYLEVGDIFLCDLPNSEGSFSITAIDVPNNKFEFVNLFATPGSVTQVSEKQTKFLRPEKIVAYRSARRALAWETQPGRVVVEMPTTPTVIRRELKGGFHINGSNSSIVQINGDTSLTVADASSFPPAGQFVIEPKNSIVARLTGGAAEEVVAYETAGRLISNLTRYSYSSISGNTLLGVTPNLPAVAQAHEVTLTAMTKTGGVVTCTGANDFLPGESVNIRNSSGVVLLSTTGNTTASSPIVDSIGDLAGVAPGQLAVGAGIPVGATVISVSAGSVVLSHNATATANGIAVTFRENTNGTFPIVSANGSSFTFNQLGLNGAVTALPNQPPGVATVERIELSNAGSTLYITTARPASETNLPGPYVWDERAPFVLSSHVATSIEPIVAGHLLKLLNVSANTIPDEEGYIVVDYGQNNQEGPIRYLYKPAENSLALDSSYIFRQNHDAGCSVIALSHKGAHTLSGVGGEYSPYITSPSEARTILQELIKSVTSAGFFVDFLVRYPTQLYGVLTVYD